MSLRIVGVVLLLLGSFAIGIGFGELCFRLFVSAVPRIELSSSTPARRTSPTSSTGPGSGWRSSCGRGWRC